MLGCEMGVNRLGSQTLRVANALLEATDRQKGWGWAGSVGEYLAASPDAIAQDLAEHHFDLLGTDPSESQARAWRATDAMLRETFSHLDRIRSGTRDWSLVFEYELPFEGGRRPDVILLAARSLFVLEFKETSLLTLAHADQVEAYARDIRDYHSESRDLEVTPILVSSAGVLQRQRFPSVRVAGTAEQLADELSAPLSGEQPDLEQWLAGSYAPLPTIVDAARRIFQHEPLPRIWTAESAGVNRTVDVVQELGRRAKAEGKRLLVLIAGVPGSGKTLAGLRIVYEHQEDDAPATFLSGNGPLVNVLQDALKSTVFVKDLHKAIHSYGARGVTPKHHVIVFDEAQRAWDREKMRVERQLDASEPEVLIAAGSRIEGWCAMVGLVGDGQEIHGGEEGGLGQWSEAIATSGSEWIVCCPPRLAHHFRGHPVELYEELDLTRSLRSRRAQDLHLWVSYVLGGEADQANAIARRMSDEVYPLRMFRDLDLARRYVRDRYANEPRPLYGLLASSHAKNLAVLGVDNTWNATRRVRPARWFNDPPTSEASGCQLDQPITEFMCQGLELDLPVVCWGSDMRWAGIDWEITPIRRRFPLRDPEQIVRNAYRVLLTRGRDGLVLFVPPSSQFDETASFLAEAGVVLVEDLNE